MKIQHLFHKSIDKKRWDKCIDQASNQLVYAYSWYLDIVSPNWEALVTPDYDYIMPLPVKKKYRLGYIAQPVLTQQLGVFSSHTIAPACLQAFISKIPYLSYEINMNELNPASGAIPNPNFVLKLNHPYSQIKKHYNKNTNRNLEKATKNGLIIQENLALNTYLEFYYNTEKQFEPVENRLFRELLSKGIDRQAIHLFGVSTKENELVAALGIMESSQRIIYLTPVSNNQGKTLSAMFLLVDFLIRKFATHKNYFDFEGSRIEGIARFYKGFGAKNHPYFVVKRFRPALLIRK